MPHTTATRAPKQATKAQAKPPKRPIHAQRKEASDGRSGQTNSMGPAVKLGSSVQTKLVVGQSGDKYEREADSVADRVSSGQPAGDVSRIPAGGLAAQRKEDDVAEVQEKATPESAPKAQRQAEDDESTQAKGEKEDVAQTKCADCEKKQAQKEDDGGEAQTAQLKCAACAAKDKKKAQRQDDGDESAQARSSTDGTVQRQEGGDGPEEAQGEDEPDSGGGDEENASRDCGEAGAEEHAEGAGAAPAEDRDEGGEEHAGAEGGEGSRAGGATEDLGCGEGGGEEEGAAGGAAPAGGQSCGGGDHATEGGEGEGGAGGPEGEGPQPDDRPAAPPAAAGAVPACAESVPAADDREGDPAAEPAADAGGNQSSDCGAQRKEADGKDTPVARQADDKGGEAQAQREADDEGGEAQAQREADDEGGEAQAQREADDGGEAQAQREADAGDEAPVQEQEEDESAQTRSRDSGRRPLDTRSASRLIHSRGDGEPLKPQVKQRMESSLGMDVEGIRVHSDGNAHAANRALKAKAFAHRNHIFLGAGQSQHDLSLMAHEGTHVLQQGGIARRKAATPGAPGQDTGKADAGAATSPTAGLAIAGRAVPGAKELPQPAHGRLPAPPPGAPAIPPISPLAPPAGASKNAAPGAPSGAVPVSGAPPTAPLSVAPGAPAVAGPTSALIKEGAGASAKPATTAKTGKDEKAVDKDKKKEDAPAKAKGAGGPGGGPAIAGGEAPPPAVLGDVTAAHPGAGAAAAARMAADRSRMAGVSGRLGQEASRQKGPAVSRKKQGLAAGAYATVSSDAAPSPEVEPRSIAEEAKAAELSGKTGGKVDKQSFLELVESKLDAIKTPQTLGDMEDFQGQEATKEFKGEVDKNVDSQTKNANAPIEGPLRAELKTPKLREAQDYGPVPAAPRSHSLNARDAAPAPRAEEEVTLEPNKEAVEAELAKHRLTKERLEKANDPRFTAVQKAREDVHEHANRAPAATRREESALRAGAERKLTGAEMHTASRMRGSHGMTQGGARLNQGIGTITEAMERQRVASDIEGIYKRAETKVKDKLEWLGGKEDGTEGEVDARFTRGEDQSRKNFEESVHDGIRDWKRMRYGMRAAIPLIGGLVAGGTWVYDKLKGIDEHPDVKKIFVESRKLYVSGLKITIRAIAEVVESTLKECESIIDKGKAEIDAYILNLGDKKGLAKIAKQTRDGVIERFNELREEVDAQREELADRLADRYKESEEAIDTRIKELQAENRGLVRKFIDKVKEIVAAIRNFKNKIGPILAEAGDVIDEILDDPIEFLRNILAAIDRGFSQFKARIGEHLAKGVASWLFGVMGSAGIEVPKDFSGASMGGLILQVLGLTFDKMKARVTRMIGPKAAGVISIAVDKLTTLFRGGPGALWEEMKNDIGDLKDTILEEVKSWVITRIITAAVKKLAMMFNPVGAIIQAILTIYNVIMFFLENIDRILDLVQTVVRAAADVVRGKIQTAADKIETTLGMTIPLIISFLARLTGLSGVADKVRSVIMRFKTKVDRAINKFLRKFVGKFKRMAGKAKKKAKKTIAGIAEWWKKKRQFKVKGKTHSVFFEGDHIVVQSKKRTLDQLIADHKELVTKGQGTPKGAEGDLASLYGRAITLKRALEDEKRKASKAKRAKGGTLSPEEEKEYDDLVAIIKQLMKDLQDKSTARDSVIKYLDKQDGLGKHTEAKILTIKGEDGSRPTPNVGKDVWTQVEKRRSSKGSFYVKGHLVSEHFHGKGSKEENIAPIARTTNQLFLNNVETKVKERVFGQGLPVRLSVKAEYPNSNQSQFDAWLADLPNQYPDENTREEARKIIQAEKKLPDSLVATAHVLTFKGDQADEGPNFLGPATKNLFPDSPPLIDGPKKPSLSRSRYLVIANLGVLDALALAIATEAKNGGPYKSLDEVRSRVLAFASRPTRPGYLNIKNPQAWLDKNFPAVEALIGQEKADL